MASGRWEIGTYALRGLYGVPPGDTVTPNGPMIHTCRPARMVSNLGYRLVPFSRYPGVTGPALRFLTCLLLLHTVVDSTFSPNALFRIVVPGVMRRIVVGFCYPTQSAPPPLSL